MRILIPIIYLVFWVSSAPTTALGSDTESSLTTGIGATACFDVLSWQHHPSAKQDIILWVQNFIKEVNSSVSTKQLKRPPPEVLVDREVLWFATLAYCGLDPNQLLVEAVMKLIESEWDKTREKS